MRILVDTNILVRCAEPKHRHHEIAMRSIHQLGKGADRLCVAPQIFYEYFVVCTRPQIDNGLGMSNEQTLAEIHRLSRLLEIIAESPAIFPLWLQLIEQYATIGKNAHDTRIVAAMMANQIPVILTFNNRDFQRYEKIQILDPAQIVAGS